jgi:hypothetical protein
MINKTQVFVFAIATLLSGPLAAQQMSAAWDLFVFPSGGQDADVQAVDERACLQWGQQATGVDPFNPGAGVRVSAPAQGDEGAAAAGGAMRGAVRGALIGNLADEDASDYAIAGALAGSVRGARQRRRRTSGLALRPRRRHRPRRESGSNRSRKRSPPACRERATP